MKKIKILNFILCFIVLLCCFCFLNLNKVSASTASFEEFEIGMTFPVGYELTIDNSNGVVPSKSYVFTYFDTDNATAFNFTYFINADNLFDSSDDVVLESGPSTATALIGFGYDPDGEYFQIVPDGFVLELTSIDDVSGDGLLGIKSEIVEPNYIYQGIYDLLGNLIYGTTDNLTTTQVGNLEFISQIIVIFCVLLPFIILLWVINRLFKF